MRLASLRVGLVGPVPPPPGGMANQTRQLAGLLGQEGVWVELVPTNKPYRPAWVANIRGLRAAVRLVPYIATLWRAAGRVDVFHVMGNSGWSWHLFAAPAVWIAKLRGTWVVINYRGGEADAFFERSFFWVKPSLKKADAIVVPSGFLEEVFARRGFAATIVPNVVDLERFHPVPRAPSTAGPHILVARNLEPLYDNASALRALRRVREQYPGATMTIAGEGPERQALEGLARDLGLSDAVTFTGRLDNEQMAALYRRADAMLNPSLADNMPISLMEALASGVPVVSTRVGGVPYLVEDGVTALLVPCRDPEAMAHALLRLFSDPDLEMRLRAAGLELVQRYEWPSVRDRLFAVYRAVTGRVLDGAVAEAR